MKPNLAGPRAKLARADEHRHALHAEIEAWGRLDPFMVTEPILNDEGSEFVIYGHTDPPPPDRIGLVLGDHVQNLRSALDHLVWQLTLLAGGQPEHTHQFPIANKESDFEAQAKRRLAGMRDAHIDAISQVQPFNTQPDPEQNPLALLRWLSNTDKHQVIHVIASSTDDADPDTAGFRLTRGTGTLGIPQINRGAPVSEGEPILRVALDPPDPTAEAEWLGQFDVRLVFGERRARHEAIQRLQGVVEAIVNHFTSDFA